MGRGSAGRRGAGQQKTAWVGAVVDRTFHGIPHGRVPLPFVDEDGPPASQGEVRVGGDDRSLGRDIQASDGGRKPCGSGCLSDPFGSFQGDRGNGDDKRRKFVIQNPFYIRLFLHEKQS